MDYSITQEFYEEVDTLICRFLGNSSGGGYNPREPRSLQNLAERSYVKCLLEKVLVIKCKGDDECDGDDCLGCSQGVDLARVFEYKIEEALRNEKKYINFLGNFLHKYLQEADKVYSSDEDSDEDSDESIVLDFYLSSDDESD